MMDGRVKTLHPKVHGGLLARARRRRPSEGDERPRHRAIDLVVVNLYPFEATVARAPGASTTCVENIDIGGPAMIRASAKNHDFVAIVVDPRTMPPAAGTRRQQGRDDAGAAPQAGAKAYARTAAYDAAIAELVRRPGRRDLRRAARHRRRAGPDAALRREPAPEGGLLQ
jgi:phosphoribosylaminoimidazolecarboxamide formyltransferase/IMP cyclohydrolase